MKVSVIVPVYNKAAHLRETVESLLSQSLDDCEYIFVDDGSTDDSLAILKECTRSAPAIVLTQENSGAGAARNNGIEHAKGEYVAFLDADDRFSPRMLEELYVTAKSTDADVVACSSWRCDEEGSVLGPWFTIPDDVVGKAISPADRRVNMFHDFDVVIWNKLYRTDFVKASGIRYQTCKTTNDVYFSVRCLMECGSIASVPERLVYYRRGQKTNLQTVKSRTPLDCFVPLDALFSLKRSDSRYSDRSLDLNNFAIGLVMNHIYTMGDDSAARTVYDAFFQTKVCEYGLDGYCELSLVNRVRLWCFRRLDFGDFRKASSQIFDSWKREGEVTSLTKGVCLVKCLLSSFF